MKNIGMVSPNIKLCTRCEYGIEENEKFMCKESAWYIPSKETYAYLAIEDVPYCPLNGNISEEIIGD